ncbi:MAG: MMPL family transporter [Chloroflexota bacterium]
MLYSFGLFIHRRRWLVLAVWVALLLAAVPFAPRAASNLKPGGFSNESLPASQAQEVFREQLDLSPVSLELIFESEEHTAFQDPFVTQVNAALEPLRSRPEVNSVVTHQEDPSRVSPDGRAAHVTVGLNMGLEDAQDFLPTVERIVSPGDLSLTMTGGPPLYRDISLASERDVQRAELVAFPLSAITLLIVFGTLAAALLPVAVGGFGVLLGLAALFGLSLYVDTSVFALNIVTLLGIGLGIDYSLFFTNRFREELAAGKSTGEAIAATEANAGHAILFSGVTSLIGLSALMAFDFMMLRSVGMGAVIVISAALLSALTLMPALLAVLGPRVNALRVLPGRVQRVDRDLWRRWSLWVMRRPLMVAVPTAAALVLVAAPVLDIRLGTVDATILPSDLESRQGFDLLQEEFSEFDETTIPIAYTFGSDEEWDDPLEPETLTRLHAFGQALEGLENVKDVRSIVNIAPDIGPERYAEIYRSPASVTDNEIRSLLENTTREGAVLFTVTTDLPASVPETRALIGEIRSLDPGPGSQTWVDGGPAEIKDIVDSLYSRFPLVAGAVVAVTYISLMILFRSVVLPLKAILLNVMSILASYGALVFVFQQGHLAWLLGFEPLGVIEATTPILLFSIIFGLSMDYEIFLLSRVSEAYGRTGDNTESVAEGLRLSGRIITGAAAILIVVALSFLVADVVLVKAIGLGLAIAVFIDVTIVRALLAPALMRLMGGLNWWMPRWLDRALPGKGSIR